MLARMQNKKKKKKTKFVDRCTFEMLKVGVNGELCVCVCVCL